MDTDDISIGRVLKRREIINLLGVSGLALLDGTQLTLSLTQASGGSGYTGTFNIYLQIT